MAQKAPPSGDPVDHFDTEMADFHSYGNYEPSFKSWTMTSNADYQRLCAIFSVSK